MSFLYRKHTPFRGLPAKLVSVQDDSNSYEMEGTRIEGEIHLLPQYPPGPLVLKDAEFSRAGYLYTSNPEISRKFFKQVKPGDHLFIDGDLSPRLSMYKYPHLETLVWIEGFSIDKTKGEVHPYACRVFSSDREEYTNTAEARFGTHCPHCGGPTQQVAHQHERFCPPCER